MKIISRQLHPTRKEIRLESNTATLLFFPHASDEPG